MQWCSYKPRALIPAVAVFHDLFGQCIDTSELLEAMKWQDKLSTKTCLSMLAMSVIHAYNMLISPVKIMVNFLIF